jgi:hypothetical protein
MSDVSNLEPKPVQKSQADRLKQLFARIVVLDQDVHSVVAFVTKLSKAKEQARFRVTFLCIFVERKDILFISKNHEKIP